MNPRIRNLESTVLADNWGVLKSSRFELQRQDGSWQTQVRETYDKGDGAAILLYEPIAGTVILTRQFRFPAYLRGEAGYLIEACAGKLDGDDPQTCATREAGEETGYQVTDVRKIMEAYVSPGVVTEKLHLFVARYTPDQKVASGGGLADEGEDIEVLEIGFEQALDMIRSGEITDAKTILLLQYAALNRLCG